MGLTRGLEAQEPLKAQTHVWNHACHFVSSMSLKCAIDLGIPDIIENHGRPMTLPELVDSLPVAPARASHLGRLMRLLVHSGFFALQKIVHESGRTGEEYYGYVLTPSSRLLLSESQVSQSPLVLVLLGPLLNSQWQLLSRWFQGEEASNSVMAAATGLDFWDYMAQHPEESNRFNGAIAIHSRLIMEALVNECGGVFQGVGSIVDVGGGTGESAMAIARAFPQIKCTVFDLPHVVAAPMTQATKSLDFVGGDMFETIPKADALFLKSVLHDWSDADCVRILKQCKEAIPSKEKGGGKVIIVDMVIVDSNKQADPKLTETQLYFDMSMMVHSGGKEREEHEWSKIFMDAGFNQYKITAVLGLRSVIELYP